MRSLLLFIFYYLIAYSASAAPIVENPSKEFIPDIGSGNVLDGIGNAIAYLIGVSSVLGVIAITWGGIQMAFAAGDEEKVKKARWIIIYALIGVTVSAGAYGLVSFFGNIKL